MRPECGVPSLCLSQPPFHGRLCMLGGFDASSRTRSEGEAHAFVRNMHKKDPLTEVLAGCGQRGARPLACLISTLASQGRGVVLPSTGLPAAFNPPWYSCPAPSLPAPASLPLLDSQPLSTPLELLPCPLPPQPLSTPSHSCPAPTLALPLTHPPPRRTHPWAPGPPSPRLFMRDRFKSHFKQADVKYIDPSYIIR